MGLLDKLKPQPRWKHADPVVRLEALRDLSDPAEIGMLAESDPDVRVRRAAISRVSLMDVLGRVAAGDADAEARDKASDRLLSMACRLERGPALTNGHLAHAEEIGLAAVRQLTDPRRLSTVAKSDAPDAVRADALARIVDARGLSGVARQAKRESTASEALSRLSDPAELLEVALHGTHADVALAALEQLI